MPKYLEDMPEKSVLEDTDLLPGKDMTKGKASKITMLGIAEYIIKKITTLPGVVKSHLENKNNPHGVTKAQIGLGNVENKSSETIRNEITADNVKKSLGYTPLDASKKGAANGVAELDTAGKVPSSQLPSFVDDVLEGYLSGGKFYEESTHATLINGETGKIYIDLSSGKTYRWSGSTYAEISESLALGETSSTAYRGDKGKTAYDHAQKTSGNPHRVTKSDVGLGNVPNVATNDQTPTFTVADNDTALQSGEKLSVSLGKIARAILSVISLKKDVAELNSNITLKTLEGTGCTVSHNNAIVLLGILVNDLNMGSNATTNKIVLPSNVTPISDKVFITTDILNTAWGPQNVEAFLHFAPGQKSPNIRFDVSSVSGAVIAGTFVFPRDYFSIS